MPDLHKAYIFYCDGLGFTQDPGTWSKQRGGFKVLWFNLGRHQVHASSDGLARAPIVAAPYCKGVGFTQDAET